MFVTFANPLPEYTVGGAEEPRAEEKTAIEWSMALRDFQIGMSVPETEHGDLEDEPEEGSRAEDLRWKLRLFFTADQAGVLLPMFEKLGLTTQVSRQITRELSRRANSQSRLSKARTYPAPSD